MEMRITAEEAYKQLASYRIWIEEVRGQVKKNYTDMDFENAIKVAEMGELVQTIIDTCNDEIDRMEKARFEE